MNIAQSLPARKYEMGNVVTIREYIGSPAVVIGYRLTIARHRRLAWMYSVADQSDRGGRSVPEAEIADKVAHIFATEVLQSVGRK